MWTHYQNWLQEQPFSDKNKKLLSMSLSCFQKHWTTDFKKYFGFKKPQVDVCADCLRFGQLKKDTKQNKKLMKKKLKDHLTDAALRYYLYVKQLGLKVVFFLN